MLLSGVLVVVVGVILAFYKEWKITSFDPALAASLGIPVVLMHYVFMSLVSITTVAAFDAVGAIMVVAMLITPAAAAYLWTDRLLVMMGLSGVFGVIAAFMGYYIAVWLDTSISGSMAFSTGIIFMISFLFSPGTGWHPGWCARWTKSEYSLFKRSPVWKCISIVRSPLTNGSAVHGRRSLFYGRIRQNMSDV